MNMNGETRIVAPREAVYAALNDVEVLQRAIPGCESIERLSDTEMTATVVARVGPVRAKFNGRVTFSDLDPPESYTIAGEGKGGAAGFAKGSARVELESDGEVTILRYTVKADVGGKLAQVGSRLIDGTAKKMADDFFARFAEELANGGGVPATAAAPATTAKPESPGWTGHLGWWALGGAIALIALYLLVGR
jgi:carbon monoxide dehydrogenase subunit G